MRRIYVFAVLVVCVVGVLLVVSTRIDRVKLPLEKNISRKYRTLHIDTTGNIKTVYYIKGEQ